MIDEARAGYELGQNFAKTPNDGANWSPAGGSDNRLCVTEKSHPRWYATPSTRGRGIRNHLHLRPVQLRRRHDCAVHAAAEVGGRAAPVGA